MKYTATTTTRIYDHNDYLPPLKYDILHATGSIDIHVPYISKRVLKEWAPWLRNRAEAGVIVRIFLQKPRYWEKRDDPDVDVRLKTDLNELNGLIKLINSIGAKPIFLDRIHAKLIVIDERILWEGSLNFLSHFDTTEHVRRSVNPREVDEVRKRHQLGHDINSENSVVDNDHMKEMIVLRRRELNMSQGELARAASCDDSQVSRFESGKITGIHPVLLSILKGLRLHLELVPAHLVGPVRKLVQNSLRAQQEKTQ